MDPGSGKKVRFGIGSGQKDPDPKHCNSAKQYQYVGFLYSPDDVSAGLLAHLMVALALPHNLLADVAEGGQDELPDGVHVTRGQHKVVRPLLLQHQPHPLHIVLKKG